MAATSAILYDAIATQVIREGCVMATVDEATRRAAEEKATADLREKCAKAKPTTEMFQYIAATQAAQTGFIVTLLDGTTYTAERADSFFTDGLSIVDKGHRIFFPTTSIKSILIRNPGEK
jgi:membrane protein involved in colicin uptake